MMQRPQGSTFSITHLGGVVVVEVAPARQARQLRLGHRHGRPIRLPGEHGRRSAHEVPDQPGGRADTVEYGQHDDLVAVGLSVGKLGPPGRQGARRGPVLSLASALPVAGAIRLVLSPPAAGSLIRPLVLPFGAGSSPSPGGRRGRRGPSTILCRRGLRPWSAPWAAVAARRGRHPWWWSGPSGVVGASSAAARLSLVGGAGRCLAAAAAWAMTCSFQAPVSFMMRSVASPNEASPHIGAEFPHRVRPIALHRRYGRLLRAGPLDEPVREPVDPPLLVFRHLLGPSPLPSPSADAHGRCRRSSHTHGGRGDGDIGEPPHHGRRRPPCPCIPGGEGHRFDADTGPDRGRHCGVRGQSGPAGSVVELGGGTLHPGGPFDIRGGGGPGTGPSHDAGSPAHRTVAASSSPGPGDCRRGQGEQLGSGRPPRRSVGRGWAGRSGLRAGAPPR